MIEQRYLLGAGAAALLGAASPTSAAPAHFDIAPQALPEALRAFGLQSGVSVAFKAQDLRHARSAPAVGEYEPRAALTAILKGTSYHAVSVKNGFVVLASADGAAMAPLESAAAAPANEPPAPPQIEEIIVTAQRSAQNLQVVPIAVTALQGSRLDTLKVSSTKDLDQLVPSLVMDRKQNAVQPFLRGVGLSSSASGVESPVATYVDGVYVPNPVGATFDLPDVERIEVLKGPQGTLFGRNATAGAISIVTRRPTATPTLEADVGYANYRTFTGRAFASGPLADNLLGSLSFYLNDQGEGWGKDVTATSSQDFRLGRTIAARGKLLWEPAPDTEVELGGFYINNRGNLTTFAAYPGQLAKISAGASAGQSFVNPYFYGSVGDFYNNSRNSYYGGNLRAETGLGDFRLINNFAYQELVSTSALEIFGGTPFVDGVLAAKVSPDRTFSDELRLQSPDGAKNRWVLGLYYLNEDLSYRQFNFNTAPPYTAQAYSDVGTRSVAPFADGTYHFTDAISLTGGLRYTWDRRSLTGISVVNAAGVVTPFADRELNTSKLTYRVALQWQATDSVMTYISQSRGFKAGFFNLGGAAGTAPPLQPEILAAQEIGLKSVLFDHRLRLNLAAFRNSYENIVVQQTLTVNGLTTTFQTNAATARILGVDADFDARVTEAFSVSGGLSFMPTAKYTEYVGATLSSYDPATGLITSHIGPATDNRLIQAPRFQGQLQALYHQRLEWGDIDLAGSMLHRSRIYFGADNRVTQPPITLLNASAKWTLPGSRYFVTIWGKNLTDKKYLTDAVQSAGVDIVVPGSPRTFGFTLGLRL